MPSGIPSTRPRTEHAPVNACDRLLTIGALLSAGRRGLTHINRYTRYASDTYGLANVGVGLRFNRSRMAVVPSVYFAFGRDFDTDPSFGVTCTTSF